MGGQNKYSKFTLFQTKHILNIYFVSELSLARFRQSSGAMEITARYECLYTFSKVEKKAACKNCDTVYSFDPQLTGYKILREHYRNKHSDHFSEFVRKRKPQGPASGAPITKFFPQSSAEVEQKQKNAIAYCVEKHSLPLNIYEDKCNEWALGIKMTSENTRSEIRELYGEIWKQMLCKLENKVSIGFDGCGWKNSTTHNKHMCFLLFEISVNRLPIFWKRFVYDIATALGVEKKYNEVMHDLNEVKVQPVGIIADNAKNCQSAISATCQKSQNVVGLRCGAHIINLKIQKALTTVGPLSTANDTFVRAIEKDKISRYAKQIECTYTAVVNYSIRAESSTQIGPFEYRVIRNTSSIESRSSTRTALPKWYPWNSKTAFFWTGNIRKPLFFKKLFSLKISVKKVA